MWRPGGKRDDEKPVIIMVGAGTGRGLELIVFILLWVLLKIFNCWGYGW